LEEIVKEIGDIDNIEEETQLLAAKRARTILREKLIIPLKMAKGEPVEEIEDKSEFH